MVNLGLIKCEKELDQPINSSFYNKLKFWLTKRKVIITKAFKVDCIEIDENIKLSIINLPITRQKLEAMNINSLDQELSKLQKDQTFDFIGIPSWLGNSDEKININYIKAENYTEAIFSSAIKPVLEMTFVNKGLPLTSIEIVLICSQMTLQIETLIAEIIPYINFLTVIGPENAELRDYVENIFEETGLCISLPIEFKKAINGASLILNFDDTGILKKYLSLNKKMPILNFCSQQLRIESENPIINDILLDPPVSLKKILIDELGDLYDVDELTKIILVAYSKRIDTEYINAKSNTNKVLQSISKLGINITGFKGIRGYIKV